MGAMHHVLPSLLVAIVAIACGPQPPQYRDPLAELALETGTTIPSDIAVKAGPKVALVFGANVERFLKYHDDGNAYAASVGASKSLLAEGNPQYLLNGTVEILKRRYPRINELESLAAAQRSGISTTLVVDIQTKAGMYPGDDTSVDLVIIAFDVRQRPISRITARGATQIRAYAPPRIREAHDRALNELSQKADRLLN